MEINTESMKFTTYEFYPWLAIQLYNANEALLVWYIHDRSYGGKSPVIHSRLDWENNFPHMTHTGIKLAIKRLIEKEVLIVERVSETDPRFKKSYLINYKVLKDKYGFEFE